MNCYTCDYIEESKDLPAKGNFNGNLEILKENKAGETIGLETQSVWLRPYPVGFRKLMKWISDRYDKPVIYVTENGTSLKGENDLLVEQLLEDDFRVDYFRNYITELAKAQNLDGVDVRGYMAWSLLE